MRWVAGGISAAAAEEGEHAEASEEDGGGFGDGC